METFKELKKLGYKHYTENTIEELDNLPLNSEERIMEQTLVFRWFREKYKKSHIWLMDELLDSGEYTYEEAELECLRKLIEICKQSK